MGTLMHPKQRNTWWIILKDDVKSFLENNIKLLQVLEMIKECSETFHIKANQQFPSWQPIMCPPHSQDCVMTKCSSTTASDLSSSQHVQWPHVWPCATVLQRTADMLTNDWQTMWPWQHHKRWWIPTPRRITRSGCTNYFQTGLGGKKRKKKNHFFEGFYSESDHQLAIKSSSKAINLGR